MTGVCPGSRYWTAFEMTSIKWRDMMAGALQTKEAMIKYQGLIHWCLSRDVHGRQTMIDSNHLNHYLGRIHVIAPAI